MCKRQSKTPARASICTLFFIEFCFNFMGTDSFAFCLVVSFELESWFANSVSYKTKQQSALDLSSSGDGSNCMKAVGCPLRGSLWFQNLAKHSFRVLMGSGNWKRNTSLYGSLGKTAGDEAQLLKIVALPFAVQYTQIHHIHMYVYILCCVGTVGFMEKERGAEDLKCPE